MRQTLDIHDYYFGVIVATPEYLESSKRVRLLDGIDYDPFSEITDMEALIFGVTTLLKRETKMDVIPILISIILGIRMNLVIS